MGHVDRQRGVALISVLLVVVIATLLSVSMIRDQNLTIHKVRNGFDQLQAQEYAYGGEELARQILWEDRAETGPLDHLAEEWAVSPMLFEFEQGEVAMEIKDLRARINVNALAGSDTRSNLALQRLTNIIAHQGLDPMLMDRLMDWVDKNDSARSLGAEDYEYLGLVRPYRTANQPMADITEVNLLLEIEPETITLLSPLISAIPSADSVININTAAPEVLQSLSSGLTADISLQLAQARDDAGGFSSVTEFLQSPLVAGMGIQESGLSVQSDFFEVRIQARYLERYGYLTSIIQRNPDDGSLQVVYRNSARRVFFATEDNTPSLQEGS